MIVSFLARIGYTVKHEWARRSWPMRSRARRRSGSQMSTPTGHARRVFVSHSHHDSEFCERLVNTLRTAGLDVWLDDQNLGAGHLPRIIEAELRSRDTFIVVFSPAALTSQWVESEWYA